ncbi:unnamed protein product [Vitrella brassicaformis CCMP3155]|uniref:Uncharacterized protein n=1 Tax=Vitrella brassicaformis (strain CCMP3155) TaxID=1169540 RepID=A0A0G4FW53_VITBC|nr:unnamed protein product [Vitrella brassicaformis CCMP3155]|eukprot:CEM19220.1 unnamed protein product [Vitrella brassicaformis CCMP3155]
MGASSSAAAAPQAEAMPSPTPCRYKEGSRVQMVTSKREKGKQRWVKADVYRIEEGSSGRTALHLREVGGHREEFKVLVPHNETKTSPHGQQAHGGFRLTHKNLADQDDNTTALRGLGDDHLSCVFSLMTPRELSALPTLSKQWPQVRKGALRQQTHIAIDSSTEDARQFWDNMTPEEAFQLGKKLVNLTALTLVQPRHERSWCLRSMICIVEGHAAGRREACETKGQQHMSKGSLETVELTTTSTTTTSNSSPPFQLSPLTEPPTLHALRAVSGAVRQHRPLRHLQTIGGITWAHKDEGQVRRLQDVLSSRGCRRSLTRLDVEIAAFEDHDTLSALLAVDGFINTCCVSPDVPLKVTGAPGDFELSLLYADAFPPRPSPFIKTAIKDAARQAIAVTYSLSQHDLTHPLDDPSQAAVEMASSLSFDKAEYVVVCDAISFVPPPGTPPPTPAIINHLQQLPGARDLDVYSAVGVAAGRLLAQKMPMQVGRVCFGAAVSAQDRIGVLEALGERVAVGNVLRSVSL